MVFTSEIFLFIFLPITFFVYYLLPSKFKNIWLLIVSILFYAYKNVMFVFLMFLFMGFNYGASMTINYFNEKNKIKFSKITLVVTIISNVLLLYYFKYFQFTFNTLSDFLNWNFCINNIVIPIGISFYTFQGLSYVIDIYRKKINFNYNFFDFALYISFFPQLVAGPIIRYDSIENELSNKKLSIDGVASGLKRFIIGFFKKIVLADGMALIVNPIWNLSSFDLTISIAWFGVICYAFQIYFDFSGYSDMAIGLGKMFGFNIPENFNFPYVASSIKDFWRRWHISLSSWFRDYVYIPLGGNRKNKYLNIFIVFLLTGIWHGSGVNFILWGIWNALFMILDAILNNHLCKLNNNFFFKIIKRLSTLIIILLGWVLFRSNSFEQAIYYIESMFSNSNVYNPGFSINWFLTKYNFNILLVCIFLSLPISRKIYQKLSNYVLLENLLVIALFIISIMTLLTSGYTSFIYFQF